MPLEELDAPGGSRVETEPERDGTDLETEKIVESKRKNRKISTIGRTFVYLPSKF